MTKGWSRRTFLHGSLLAATGCGARLAGFPFDHGKGPGESNQLSVTYYSVGCLRVRYRQAAFLTDPFWSHRPLSEVAFGELQHDHAEIDKHRAAMKPVTAVLVGHSHYDHCLDLEPISKSLDPKARIYGSQTLKHLYAATDLGRAVLPMNAAAATPQKAGEWQLSACGRMRFLPILSGHPNQWLFFHLWHEQLHKDRLEKPRYAADFQEGITLAFMVDFLDQGRIAKRIFVQTSSTGYPAGFPPPSVLKERAIDVAILPMDCANLKVAGAQPNLIDTLPTKTVIFCHWEDFFEPKSGIPKEIMKVDLPDLKAYFNNSPERRYLFPYWNQRFVIG